MKMTIILLTITFLHASAGALAQTVTLSVKNTALEKVFTAVEKQTGYVFFYDGEMLKDTKLVTITASKLDLGLFLEEILKEQSLDYSIEKKTILIRKKKEPFPPVTPAGADIDSLPVTDLHGTVLDSLGNPLAGASVMVKGGRRGSSTNEKGQFLLKHVEQDITLEISYTAYETRRIRVNHNDNLVVILKESKTLLDAPVIQAYGTTTKRFAVGSIATVSSKEIEKQPVTNALLALEGQVPGLSVTPVNGAPGSTVQVQIRGQNSLRTSPYATTAYDQPLFIVDGVPFAPQNNNINLLMSAGGNNFSNPYGGLSGFNSINPLDIESISILKDADATSIYGSQGANGVVLITTKKGKAGKTDFSLSANTGPNKVTRQIKLLNTQQYLALRREALQNDGIVLTPADKFDYPELLLFDTTKYTDWGRQFFGGTSNNSDLHASFTGGAGNSNYIVSAGYTRATYNFPGDFAENRLSLHSNFHVNSADHRLSVDFGTDLSYDRNNSSGQPAATGALKVSPDYPDMIDPAGKLVWDYKGLDLTLTGNQQYSYLKQTHYLQNLSLNNNLRLGYQVIRGLTLSANLGYSRLVTREHSEFPLSSQSPTSPYSRSSANFARNEFQTINIEPQLDYKHTLGNGSLTLLAGGTYKNNLNTSENLSGDNYPNDALLGSIGGATTILASNTSIPYKYAAVYGRIGYVYDNKYIVNITGRRDGSSNFGPGRQFGNFGSVGLGWIFSEEGFLKRSLPFISYAKLSGNYGTNGSDGVAAYQYQAYWTTSTFSPVFQGTRSYNPVNLYNPDYSWSSKRSWNGALDLGFLQDRLLVNATWYLNRTGNQLTGYSLPSQAGFGSVLENIDAKIQNTGWEFTISSTNIRKKDFIWSTNFNLSFNRNKLLAFPGLENSPYASTYTIGMPTDIINGFKYKGVNDSTGLFQFYTGKGTFTYNPDYKTALQGGDYGPIVNVEPKYSGGLGNSFTYKGLSLSVFFQFSKRLGRNYLYSLYYAQPVGGLFNVPLEALSHWRNPGDHSALQKASSSTFGPAADAAYAFTASSGSYSDASYIRLKTLSLAYTFPGSYLKKAGVKNCRIYVNAQNLLTITGYKLIDPETPGQLSIIPLQRTIAGGLSFNF